MLGIDESERSNYLGATAVTRKAPVAVDRATPYGSRRRLGRSCRSTPVCHLSFRPTVGVEPGGP